MIWCDTVPNPMCGSPQVRRARWRRRSGSRVEVLLGVGGDAGRVRTTGTGTYAEEREGQELQPSVSLADGRGGGGYLGHLHEWRMLFSPPRRARGRDPEWPEGHRYTPAGGAIGVRHVDGARGSVDPTAETAMEEEQPSKRPVLARTGDGGGASLAVARPSCRWSCATLRTPALSWETATRSRTCGRCARAARPAIS